ncbi:MAG: FGGY family carbohydrate kinase [Candidatus Omnitrophica bacterium]|nr:FGGY family carbohydrate kinase [Candidatus Omnitrophota bacterium]
MVLVIDSGTTNTKAFLFDRAGKPVCESRCPTGTLHPGPGMVEQEAEEWWLAALSAVQKIRRATIGLSNIKIDAIITSTQGGTFAPLDKELEPLRPGITWLDNRAKSEAGKLNRRYGKTFYLKTGHVLRGWCPIIAIPWVKKNEPEIYRKTARISFVADYLNYKMTGRFFIDQTAAGMTSFFNVKSGAWDRNLLDITGIKSNFLPEIVLSGKSGGRLKREAAKLLGLSEGIPVISGGHDQYCASLGAGAVSPGDCLLSCGTAWVLLVLTRGPVFKPGSDWTPGRHFQPGTFGLMGAISNGGVVLDWMQKTLRLSSRRPLLVPGKEKMIQVVSCFSEGKGAIKNLNLASKPQDIYRATLKALVRQVSVYLNQIKNEVEIKRLFLVGGGVKEPLLLPILTKITGLKIIVPDVNEAAARGAAFLALKYLEEK